MELWQLVCNLTNRRSGNTQKLDFLSSCENSVYKSQIWVFFEELLQQLRPALKSSSITVNPTITVGEVNGKMLGASGKWVMLFEIKDTFLFQFFFSEKRWQEGDALFQDEKVTVLTTHGPYGFDRMLWIRWKRHCS